MAPKSYLYDEPKMVVMHQFGPASILKVRDNLIAELTGKKPLDRLLLVVDNAKLNSTLATVEPEGYKLISFMGRNTLALKSLNSEIACLDEESWYLAETGPGRYLLDFFERKEGNEKAFEFARLSTLYENHIHYTPGLGGRINMLSTCLFDAEDLLVSFGKVMEKSDMWAIGKKATSEAAKALTEFDQKPIDVTPVCGIITLTEPGRVAVVLNVITRHVNIEFV